MLANFSITKHLAGHLYFKILKGSNERVLSLPLSVRIMVFDRRHFKLSITGINVT